MRKRQELSRMIHEWLKSNRNGRLTSDQWLNLVMEPLLPMVLLAIPLVVFMLFSPASRMFSFARYSRYAMPVFLVAMFVMLLLRARRYAVLPIFYDVCYAGEGKSWVVSRFSRQLIVYAADGEPVTFNRFVAQPPHLESNMPYIMYYLDEPDRCTLLSFAPAEHPDAQNWQPTDDFRKRQLKRTQSLKI